MNWNLIVILIKVITCNSCIGFSIAVCYVSMSWSGVVCGSVISPNIISIVGESISLSSIFSLISDIKSTLYLSDWYLGLLDLHLFLYLRGNLHLSFVFLFYILPRSHILQVVVAILPICCWDILNWTAIVTVKICLNDKFSVKYVESEIFASTDNRK